MGAFISKQPNGLYCRFSSIVDCPTHINMTEKDYIKICQESAKEEAIDVLQNHLQPFKEAKTEEEYIVLGMSGMSGMLEQIIDLERKYNIK
jgi:hypothetical protein